MVFSSLYGKMSVRECVWVYWRIWEMEPKCAYLAYPRAQCQPSWLCLQGTKEAAVPGEAGVFTLGDWPLKALLPLPWASPSWCREIPITSVWLWKKKNSSPFDWLDLEAQQVPVWVWWPIFQKAHWIQWYISRPAASGVSPLREDRGEPCGSKR